MDERRIFIVSYTERRAALEAAAALGARRAGRRFQGRACACGERRLGGLRDGSDAALPDRAVPHAPSRRTFWGTGVLVTAPPEWAPGTRLWR